MNGLRLKIFIFILAIFMLTSFVQASEWTSKREINITNQDNIDHIDEIIEIKIENLTLTTNDCSKELLLKDETNNSIAIQTILNHGELSFGSQWCQIAFKSSILSGQIRTYTLYYNNPNANEISSQIYTPILDEDFESYTSGNIYASAVSTTPINIGSWEVSGAGGDVEITDGTPYAQSPYGKLIHFSDSNNGQSLRMTYNFINQNFSNSSITIKGKVLLGAKSGSPSPPIYYMSLYSQSIPSGAYYFLAKNSFNQNSPFTNFTLNYFSYAGAQNLILPKEMNVWEWHNFTEIIYPSYPVTTHDFYLDDFLVGKNLSQEFSYYDIQYLTFSTNDAGYGNLYLDDLEIYEGTYYSSKTIINIGQEQENINSNNPPKIDSYSPKQYVANWKMDESSWNGILNEVVDSSINGNHGTAYNGLSTTAGYIGNAGNFDGIDDYVEIPYSPSLNVNTVNVEAYVKYTPNGLTQKIVNRWFYPGSRTWLIDLTPSGTLDVALNPNCNDEAGITFSSPAFLTPNEWHKVGFTYDSSEIKIIQDDVVVFSQSYTGGICTTGSSPIVIGSYHNHAEAFFNGLIDEVKISSLNKIDAINMNEGTSQLFTQTSSDLDGDILSYSWLLDNSQVSTAQNYVYLPDYNSAGIHNLTLAVSDGSLSTTKEWNINVQDVPIGNPNLTIEISGTLQVILKQASKIVAEFNYNFSEATLNLTNLTIEKEPASATKAYIILRGLDLQNQTKTLHMNKLNTNLNYVCIKDADINDISEISSNCQGSNESLVPCNGNNFNGYTCTQTSSEYVITGLRHSGVTEYSGVITDYSLGACNFADTNGDCLFTSDELVNINNQILLKPSHFSCNYLQADVDGDGAVTGMDAGQLRNYIINKPFNFKGKPTNITTTVLNGPFVIGNQYNIEVLVTDSDGTPRPCINVDFSTSLGVLDKYYGLTDVNGKIALKLDITNLDSSYYLTSFMKGGNNNKNISDITFNSLKV